MRALGATLKGTTAELRRGERRLTVVWTGPIKNAPPSLAITTLAGPNAEPQVNTPAPALRAGPFRGAPRARVKSPAPLLLRAETRIDRAGKSLRINRETQTGDAAFDAGVYLESEAEDSLVLAVLAEPAMRAGVIACLTLGATSVTLDEEGDLGIELPLPHNELIEPARLTAALDALAATAEAIPRLQRSHPARGFAGTLTTVAVLTAFLSLPLFAVCDRLWEPMGSDLYASVGVGGLVLWIVALPVLYFTLRGRSVSLRQLAFCAVSLAIALPLGGTDLVLVLNGLLDTSSPIVHPTRVLHLYKLSGKSPSYNVIVASWHADTETIKFAIDSSVWSTLSEGEEIMVTTTGGFLGWERLVRVAPVTERRTSN